MLANLQTLGRGISDWMEKQMLGSVLPIQKLNFKNKSPHSL